MLTNIRVGGDYYLFCSQPPGWQGVFVPDGRQESCDCAPVFPVSNLKRKLGL